MDNSALKSRGELGLQEAKEWLRTAQIDYDDYRKLVRCTWFPFIECRPEHPQSAIIHLQRCVEKLVKAIAYSSGQYSYDEIIGWSHNSFGLCLDIYIKLVETPIMKLFLDNVQGQIFRQSDARFFDHNESLRRLNELKAKAKPGSARKEMGDWAYELSTLPEEAVSKLMKSQLKSLKYAKIGAAILNHIPIGLFSKSGHSSQELSSTILKSLEKRGFLLSDGIKAFFNNEQVSFFFSSHPEEKRMSLIKNLGNLMVFGAISNATFILAALTFNHAIFPGYPGDPKEDEKVVHKLESASYEVSIGVAGSIIIVGKLTGAVLKQTKKGITSYHEPFNLISLDSSGLFKAGPTPAK